MKNSSENAKEVVFAFVDALNKEDFAAAGKLLTKDMTFNGVLGTRDGAEAYMNDMEKMKFKYDIEQTIAENDEVCLFCDINMGQVKIFSSLWYHVKEGKISSLKAIFDPRPVLEQQKK